MTKELEAFRDILGILSAEKLKLLKEMLKND